MNHTSVVVKRVISRGLGHKMPEGAFYNTLCIVYCIPVLFIVCVRVLCHVLCLVWCLLCTMWAICVCAVSCSAFVLFSGVGVLLLWGCAELCSVISKEDILAKFGLGSRLRSMDTVRQPVFQSKTYEGPDSFPFFGDRSRCNYNSDTFFNQHVLLIVYPANIAQFCSLLTADRGKSLPVAGDLCPGNFKAYCKNRIEK